MARARTIRRPGATTNVPEGAVITGGTGGSPRVSIPGAVFTPIWVAELAALKAGATTSEQIIAVGTAAALKADPKLSPATARAYATAVAAVIGPALKAGVTKAVNPPVPGAGIVGQIIAAMIPILKIAAGGTGLLVTGIALVYVAGRQTPAGKAITGAVGAVTPVGRGARVIARAAAPERAQARQIAREQRSRLRTERARSRVVTSTGGKRERVRITSRSEGRRARAAEAEYLASRGTRERERLAAFRAERARRREAPPLHSGRRR